MLRNVLVTNEPARIACCSVPLKAWEFYIGGYQPAQKWFNDRRGRTLSMEEIQHYQKIIVALVETGRIMGVIDQLNFLKL